MIAFLLLLTLPLHYNQTVTSRFECYGVKIIGMYPGVSYFSTDNEQTWSRQCPWNRIFFYDVTAMYNGYGAPLTMRNGIYVVEDTVMDELGWTQQKNCVEDFHQSNDTLYVTTYGKTFYSLDTALTWTEVSNTLPVQLTSFTVKKNMIQWETATEENCYGFEVLVNSVKIGFVEGHGTTNAPNGYMFLDPVQRYGSTVYTLKQIDRDGKTESRSITILYSPAPVVVAEEKSWFQIIIDFILSLFGG